jgi:acetyltransferase-like isoleucine patch superfamily enzyme
VSTAEAGLERLRAAGAQVGTGVRAWIGETVQIGADVRVGDDAVIVADRLELGDGVRIGAGCDLRAATLRIGNAGEVLSGTTVLAADEFTVGPAARIEERVSITCRRFETGRLFYLGHDSSVGYGGTTASTSVVLIGDRVALGPHSILNANYPITLEDQVGSGSYLTIWTHGYHFGHRMLDGYSVSFAPVHIEENVWLGYHVSVLPGVRVGRNTIVAAGAVAARDLPADVLAAGVPAVAKRPLERVSIFGTAADKMIDRLLDEWLVELDWKGVASMRLRPRILTLGTTHRVTVLSSGELPALDQERVEILLSVEDRPDLHVLVGQGHLLFELRSGGLVGEPDAIGHDLRDYLRRNALPCGDLHCFRSLPAEPFRRLLHP